MIRRLRAIALGALLFGTLTPVTASAAASDFTPDEFVAAFDSALLLGLGPIGPAPPITGDAGFDEVIRAVAEEQGYTRRANPDRPLASVDGLLLQPEAAEAWHAMRDSAGRDGISMSLTSAYRDAARQAELFQGRLLGSSDAAIRAVLSLLAAPGYSRHHTGYAIDVESEGEVFDGFADTAAFRWLSEDNYANAKAFGWIPSYPTGSDPAGPDPEPWELVWIGATNIACARFAPTASQPFCDTFGSTFATDIAWLTGEGVTSGCASNRYCPQAPLTRAQAATMIWRLAGSPAAVSAMSFADVPEGIWYDEAVSWMVDNGITTGTSSTSFSPDKSISRAEFVTFLWRFSGQPAAPDHKFVDVAPEGFALAAINWAATGGITQGTTPTTFAPNAVATRGQTAAFLHRFDTPAGTS